MHSSERALCFYLRPYLPAARFYLSSSQHYQLHSINDAYLVDIASMNVG